MKLKTIATLTAAWVLTAGMVQAQHVWEDAGGWWDNHWAYDQNAPKYTAQELSLDLFGSYINPERKFQNLFSTNIRNGYWGGGAGLNYFITRNVGLSTDFNISSKPEDLNLVDYWVGNLILRLPLGDSGFAPYIYGGGGRGMSPVWEWVYGGGVGLEYRFNPTTGIFTDGRFLFNDRSTDLNTLTLRAGLRLVF